MTIAEVLKRGTLPILEREVLLAAALNVNRSWLISHGDEALNEANVTQYTQWTERRLQGEPIAYITGSKEFYGRPFVVNRSVLIPRPSTEGLIDVALEFLRTGEEMTREVDSGIVAVARKFSRGQKKILSNFQFSILHSPFMVDIGTGSGCIAITLALELPQARVIATDSSREALEVATANARQHGVEDRIHFLFGDLLAPVENFDQPFLIISNPPYIPTSAKLPHEVVDYEPMSALFAGRDGLAVIRPLLEQAKSNPHCAGIVIECRKDEQSTIASVQRSAST